MEADGPPSELIQATEGAYVLAGAAYWLNGETSKADVWLAKFDQAGRQLGQWTYRNADADNHEGAISVREMPSGGFLMLGSTSGRDKNWVVGAPLLIRVSDDGELEWARQIDGVNGRTRSMIATRGGFAILGHVGDTDEILVIRLDAEGRVLQASTYGGRNEDQGFSIMEDSEGLLVIGGATKSVGQGDWDGLLMGIREDGEIAYCVKIGGAQEDRLKAVQQAEDGQLYVVGESEGMGPGQMDVFLTSGERQAAGLWKDCEGEITRQSIDLQSRGIELIGEKAGVRVRWIPTEQQGGGSLGTGLREAQFPIQSTSP